MTGQKGFIGKVGLVGSGRSMYVASLFILNIGLARSLGDQGFGSFQQVFIFSVFFQIFSLGIPETLYYFLPRIEDDEKAAFLGQTLLILGVSAVAVAVLLWMSSPFLADVFENPALAVNLRYFGVYGAFLIASSFADPVFMIYHRTGYLFTLSASHGLFFIVLTLWRYFFACSLETLFVSMMIYGFGKLLMALFFLGAVRGNTGVLKLTSNSSRILLQLSFAFPIAISNSIDVISKWLDKFVVSFFLGTGSLGVFAAGAIEIPFVTVFVTTVYSVISPALNTSHHKNDIEQFIALVRGALGFLAKYIWPLAVYLFIFADHLVPLVFTDVFDQAVNPFRIYLLVMPFRIFLFGVIILAMGHPRVILIAAACTLAVNVLLNIVLVLWIGFLGPAIATVASTCLQVFALLGFIITNLRIDVRKLIPYRFLADIFLVSVCAGLIAFILTRNVPGNLNAVVISLTIYTMTYIFLGSRKGVFTMTGIRDILEGNAFGKKDQDQENR